MIYLDYNATSPILPEALEAMNKCFHTLCGNAASSHSAGRLARRILEDAREECCELLDAPHSRLFFTSSGSEANNWAIRLLGPSPRHVMISAGEHASVLEAAETLMESHHEMEILELETSGIVRLSQLENALKHPRLTLLSVQMVNHETGVIQPTALIARESRNAGVLFHADAVQAIGRIPVSFQNLGVDAMSISAHKFHGPAGVGALLIHENIMPFLTPLLYGGNHQWGMRAGTESVPLAVGMLCALRHAIHSLEKNRTRLKQLQLFFESALKNRIPEGVIHGINSPRVGNTTSVGFPGQDAQALLMALDLRGICCSVGSACTSGASEVSPTLLGMNVPRSLAQASIRFSYSPDTTEEELLSAVTQLGEILDLKPRL